MNSLLCTQNSGKTRTIKHQEEETPSRVTLVRFILLYCKKYECTWIVELIFNNNKNILVKVSSIIHLTILFSDVLKDDIDSFPISYTFVNLL